jgi:hypothetical protein
MRVSLRARQCDRRTLVRRVERERHLPVRRLPCGQSRVSINVAALKAQKHATVIYREWRLLPHGAARRRITVRGPTIKMLFPYVASYTSVAIR